MPTEDQIEAARTKVRNMLHAADHGNEEGARSQDHAPAAGSVASGQSHTPGPWNYTPAQDDPSFIIRGPRLKVGTFGHAPVKLVARFSWNDDSPYFPSKAEAEANARLIAAAPALLEALKAIDALEVMEINPSNYDHEIVCELNSNAVQAALIARTALPLAQPHEAVEAAQPAGDA